MTLWQRRFSVWRKFIDFIVDGTAKYKSPIQPNFSQITNGICSQGLKSHCNTLNACTTPNYINVHVPLPTGKTFRIPWIWKACLLSKYKLFTAVWIKDGLMYVLQFACMHGRLGLKCVIVLRQLTENDHIRYLWSFPNRISSGWAWRFKEMHNINESTYNFCK